MPTKSSQLQLRLTPRQKAALKRHAAAAGLDVSAYVLQRALPPVDDAWRALVNALPERAEPSYVLAELNDLLTRTAPIEFAGVTASPPPADLAPWLRNYLAAMVEQAAAQKGVTPPPWTTTVAPLRAPWFGTTLRALYPYLLRVSPVPFKRRNLFIDSGVGTRV
ncbi:MAG: DUF1778 domain-containing protein [Gemmatimonadaceae bacterium]|nr:DUF1778 domain-containing protein [Gemmatimonadaceae bacterium]